MRSTHNNMIWKHPWFLLATGLRFTNTAGLWCTFCNWRKYQISYYVKENKDVTFSPQPSSQTSWILQGTVASSSTNICFTEFLCLWAWERWREEIISKSLSLFIFFFFYPFFLNHQPLRLPWLCDHSELIWGFLPSLAISPTPTPRTPWSSSAHTQKEACLPTQRASYLH